MNRQRETEKSPFVYRNRIQKEDTVEIRKETELPHRWKTLPPFPWSLFNKHQSIQNRMCEMSWRLHTSLSGQNRPERVQLATARGWGKEVWGEEGWGLGGSGGDLVGELECGMGTGLNNEFKRWIDHRSPFMTDSCDVWWMDHIKSEPLPMGCRFQLKRMDLEDEFSEELAAEALPEE